MIGWCVWGQQQSCSEKCGVLLPLKYQTIFYYKQMYRTKSAVSLRSLAHSVKQSITTDLTRAKSRQFIPLRISSSTINLTNNKNPIKARNFDDDYLILLDTRKSKIGSKSITNRESNVTDLWGQNVRTTREMIQKKVGLEKMVRWEERGDGVGWQQSNVRPIQKEQDQVAITIQQMEKQYVQTKQSYQHMLTTQNPKAHTKLLQDSDSLTKQLKQILSKQTQFIQHQKQLKNRILFLNEQILSIEMNFTQDLAEKQYCEQFLHQYEHSQENRFKEQAQYVMRMIQLQQENINLDVERTQTQTQLEQVQKEFKQWKVQENLQLKQRRFENKFKENRIQLMKIQQDLDHLTLEIIAKIDKESLDYSIRKVREYICSYFKKYNQININHISHGEIADGIDIFLCKEGLIKDFTKFLKGKTQIQARSNGTYSLKLIQYCDCLKKIQNLFSVQKAQINPVLTRKFEEKIIALKQNLQKLTNQKQKNLLQIKQLQQNIEIVLAQQSLSMIELINKGANSQLLFSKKQGFFNMHQIKAKVKEMKLQQIKRISRVKEIYLRLNKLEQKQTKYSELNHKRIQTLMQQRQLLTKQIAIWNKKICEIQSIKKGYESKKQKCDQLIDEAITKMKLIDSTEKTLRALEREIQQLSTFLVISEKEKIEKIKAKHLYSNSLDLLGCLRGRMSKKENLSRKDLFEQTKNIPSQKFLTDRFTKNSKIQILRPVTLRQNDQSLQEKKSAEFCIQKNEQDEKMSNKTQSSLKSQRERVSLRTLNSIVLSKCNLLESKNVVQNHKNSIKKSESMFGLLAEKKLNELNKKQSGHKLFQHSLRSVKNLNKQNISRKSSISKNTQRSTIRNVPKTTIPIKLSLEDSNRITQTARLQRNYMNTFHKSKQKVSQNKMNKKHTNAFISNKLLKRLS